MATSLLSWIFTTKRRDASTIASRTAKKTEGVGKRLTPQSFLTYGTLWVVQVCAMAVMLASPSYAGGPQVSGLVMSGDESVACGDATTAHSPWGMIHCSDSDRAYANATAAAGNNNQRDGNHKAIAQALTCALGTGNSSLVVFECAGGAASDLNNGLTESELSPTGEHKNQGAVSLLIRIRNLSANVNTASNSNADGISVDLTGGTLRAERALTINNQTTGTGSNGAGQTGTVRTIQIRGEGAVAILGVAPTRVTINNAADLDFASTNDDLVGIEADGTNVNINNSGRIGFAGSVGGTGHVGIYAAANSVSSTITNTGNINVGAGTVVELEGASNFTINFNGGTVRSSQHLVVASDSSTNTVNINVGGGTATGRLDLNAGASTINVNNGGTLVLIGSSDFGTGNNTDNVRVNSGGALHLGTASGGSDGVTFNTRSSTQGTTAFTVNSGATLRVFMDSSFNKMIFRGDLSFAGSGAVNLDIEVPSGYTLGYRVTDLIDVTGSGNTLDIGSNTTFNVRVLKGNAVQNLYGFAVSEASGENLRVVWTNVEPSSMSCSYASNVLGCTGGSVVDNEFRNGLNMNRMFADTGLISGSHTGSLTVNLNNLTGVVSNSSSGTGRAMTFDGTASGSTVSQDLTVNNQTSSATRRAANVRGANQAALYVKSNRSVTINNAAALVFTGTANSNRRGIEAVSGGTGNVNITTQGTGRIGFSSVCTINCGSGHRGIYVNHGGTGSVTVTNGARISLGGAGVTAAGIRVDAGSTTASINISNSGNISSTGGVVVLTGGASDDNATINFQSGTVSGQYLVNSTFAGATTVSIRGTATGRITLGGGNDAVTVRGGTTTLSSGTSNFGGGTDSLTVNSGATLNLGDAADGSDNVTLSSLSTFTIKSGATLNIFLDSNFTTTSSRAFFFSTGNLQFDGSGAITINVRLPSGYTLADRAAFDLIDVGGGSNSLDFINGASLSTLTVNVLDGSDNIVTVDGYTLVVTEANENLRLAWSLPITCGTSNSNRTLTCTGASGGLTADGLTLAEIFANVSGVSSITGDGVISLNDFRANVNTSTASDNDGIAIDGSVTNGITGSITVNHQTNSTTKRDVFVRGEGAIALYVNSRAGVTVTNAANLVFAAKSTGYEDELYGIEAASAGSGNTTTITNSGRIGFASTCSTNCGTDHVGIFSDVATGSGANSVTNSGTINVRTTASTHTDSTAIFMDGGTPTVTNTGTIMADGAAVYLRSLAGNPTINFNSGTVSSRDYLVEVASGNNRNTTVNVRGGTATGRFIFRGGADTVTVSGGTLNLTAGSDFGGGNDSVTVNSGGTLNLVGASNFGGGNDIVNVNSGGTLQWGNATTRAENSGIRGLTNFTIRSGATLRLFVGANIIASRSSAVTLTDGNLTFNGSGTVTLEVVLPANYAFPTSITTALLIANNGTVRYSSGFANSNFAVRVRLAGGRMLSFSSIGLQSAGSNLVLTWAGAGLGFGCGRTVENASAVTLNCGGGVAANVANGITLPSFFGDESVLNTRVEGRGTVNISDLAANVNTNASSTGHGIEIDGADTAGSVFARVTGNLIVNNQTTGTKRDVFVRGSGKAALRVRGALGTTVNNAGNLVFAQSGGAYAGELIGIRAIANNGAVTVTNSGRVGFSTACNNCNNADSYGIFTEAVSGSAAASTVTNSGTIIARNAIFMNGGRHQTVTNTGTITAFGSAVRFSGTSGNMTVNFNGGTAISQTNLVSLSNTATGYVAVNVNGGTATGRFNLNSNDSQTVVNDGGTLVISSGTSNFGGGRDDISVNDGGTIQVGDSISGSDGVTLNGLENFHVIAGATLRVFMDSRFSTSNDAAPLTLNANLAFDGEVTTLPSGRPDPSFVPENINIDVTIPNSYSFTGPRAAFTIIDVSGAGNAINFFDREPGVSMTLRVFQAGGGQMVVQGGKVLEGTGETLRVSWEALSLGTAATASTMDCTYSASAATLSCENGTAGGTEFSRGLNMNRFFSKATGLSTSVPGDLTLSVDDLAGNVGTSNIDSAFIADGTANQSRVPGNLWINLQKNTSDSDKVNIGTRIIGSAAAFIKHDRNVTLDNDGGLVFFARAGGSYLDNLIAAQVEGLGEYTTVINRGTMGFSSACTSNCGSGHKGIYVKAESSSASFVRVTNETSGTIRIGNSASTAIEVDTTSASANVDITISNKGTIIGGANITAFKLVGTRSGDKGVISVSQTGLNNSAIGTLVDTTGFAGNAIVEVRELANVRGDIDLGAGSDSFYIGGGYNQGTRTRNVPQGGQSGQSVQTTLFTVNNGFAGGSYSFGGSGNLTFGAGTDTMTVGGTGTLTVGSSASVGGTITGLENFHLRGLSTLHLYFNNDLSNAGLTFTGTTNVTVDGTHSSGTTIVMHLPSGVALGDRTSWITLIQGSVTLNRATRDVNLPNTITSNNALNLRLADITAAQGLALGMRFFRGTREIFADAEVRIDPNTNNLQVRWVNLRASASIAPSVDCSRTISTNDAALTCAGGSAFGMGSGVNLNDELGGDRRNVSVAIGTLGADINSRATGTGHGLELDGTSGANSVSGNITVTNQSNSVSPRAIQVRGSGNAALYVKAAASVGITNGGDLVFVQNGTSYANNLDGISAESGGSGGITVTNTGSIGFVNRRVEDVIEFSNGTATKTIRRTVTVSSSCSANCGNQHIGILADHKGSGSVSVTNQGNIFLGAGGTGNGNRGIVVQTSGSTGGTMTNSGSGVILGGANTTAFGAISASGNININVSGGRVEADNLVSSSGNSPVIMRVTGGTAQGRIVTGGGNDTVTVSGTGTLIIAGVSNDTNNFGGGNADTINVNSGGTVALGNASDGSDRVTIAGLENFNVNAGGTLRLYMDASFNAANIAATTAFAGTGNNAPVIEVYLHENYTLATQRSEFTIFDASAAITASATTLTDMARRVRLVQGNTTYRATFTLNRDSNDTTKLNLTWTDAYSVVDPSAFTCSLASGTLACTGPRRTDFNAPYLGREYLQGGVNLNRFFQKVSTLNSGIHSGDLTVNINNLGNDLAWNDAQSPTNSTITIDGSAGGSRVTGNLIVNNQTTSSPAFTAYVRAASQAALYAKAITNRNITVTNEGNLFFGEKSGGGYNSVMRGLSVVATGTGNAMVTNSADIGFESACTSNCGANQRGIMVGAATGTITIVNSGNIAIGSGGSSDADYNRAIYVFSGSDLGNVTITNTGNISGGSNSRAVYVAAGTATSNSITVNFNGGTVDVGTLVRANATTDLAFNVNVNGGTAKGQLVFSDDNDNDTVTVSGNTPQGGTLQVGTLHLVGTSNFYGGTDAITVNNGGRLIMGTSSTNVTLTGLENFNLNANGILEVFGNFSITGTASISGSGSNAPTVVVHLPTGTGNGNYGIISANTTTIADAAGLVSKARFTLGGVVASPFTRTFSNTGGNFVVNLTMLDTASGLTCVSGGNDFSCTGGSGSEYTNGFLLSRFFGHANFVTNTGAVDGGLRVWVDGLSANVNTSGTGHGMTFDATANGSLVTGDLRVFNQVKESRTETLNQNPTRRQVQVRAAERAAIFAKASGDLYVESNSPLVFAGSNVNNMRGIHAVAGRGKATTVSNKGNIGFVSCTSNCGSGHRGIFVEHTGTNSTTGQTAATITNSGAIDFGVATNSVGIYVSHTNNSGNITVTNSGTVALGTGSVFAEFAGSASSARTFTVNIGNSVVADTIVKSPSNANFNINITGGDVSGSFNLRSGNDTVRITGGSFNVGSSADFGLGNNSVIAEQGGTFAVTSGAALTGLDNFTANAGGALRVYLGDSFDSANSTVLNLGGAYSLNGTGESAARLEIYLPNGYVLGARSRFAFITAGTASVASLSDVAANARLYYRGSRLKGTLNVIQSGSTLQLEWLGDISYLDFGCAPAAGVTNAFNCSGGVVSEVEDGLASIVIFEAAGITSSVANPTFNFDDLAANVGSKSNIDTNGHGIVVDATLSSSLSGNLTVNNQVNTASADKVDVFVRGLAHITTHVAALYVKSDAGVTVNNAADLVFHRAEGTTSWLCVTTGSCPDANRPSNPYRNNLAGITAVSAGSGSVAITNSAAIGFNGNCTDISCGGGHRGINVQHGGSGTVTITNSGDINIQRGAAFYVEHGNNSGDVTITSSGNITVQDDHSAVRIANTGSSSQTVTINLTGGDITAGEIVTTSSTANFKVNLNISSTDVMGSLSLGRGNDTVTVSDSAKFTLGSPFNFGAGDDSLIVRDRAQIIAGNATDGSDDVQLNGLESVTFSNSASLTLFLDSGFNAAYSAWTTAQANLSTVTANSSSTQAQIRAAQTALRVALGALDAKAFKVQGQVAFQGRGNNAPIIRIHLPSGFALEGAGRVPRPDFTIIATQRIYRTNPGSVASAGVTAESLRDMASRVRIIQDGQILSVASYLTIRGFDSLNLGWVTTGAPNFNVSQMDCRLGGEIVNCSGGVLGSNEFNSGISLIGILERLGVVTLGDEAQTGFVETGFVLNLDNLVSHVNLTGSGYGIYVDGRSSLSEVRGNLTVNNQVRTADDDKKDVYVRASEQAGIFVNSAKAATVTNAGNIFFRKIGNTANYSNAMIALSANSLGAGRLHVTNNARIGFDEVCIAVTNGANCGSELIGISASQHEAGATIVVNNGSINVGGGNDAIFVQQLGGVGTVTITNNGNITAKNAVIFSQIDGDPASDTAVINFSGGVVRTAALVHADRFNFEDLDSPDVDLSTLDLNAAVCNDADTTNDTDACKVDSGFVGKVTVNVTGGLNVGNFVFNRAVSSDDTVNVTGGILVLPSVTADGGAGGVSDFGRGTDTLSVGRGGTLVLGSPYVAGSSSDPNETSIPTGSSSIQFSGLENFNLNAGATLRLYLDDSVSSNSVNAARINSTVSINSSANIDINLPSGYTIGDKTAFTLIDATALDVGSLRILSNRVRIFDSGGVLYQGTITLSQSGEDLQIAWSDLTQFAGASSMNCSYTSIARSIQCSGGDASDTEFSHGMNLTRIFNDVSFGRGGLYNNGQYSGNLTINLSGLTTTVNTAGLGHGIAIEAVTVVPDDPTDSNTTFTTTRYIAGDLTVNNQVTGTRGEVQVRGGTNAALYVAAAANVTVNNAADLRFKTKDTGFYDDSLTGLSVSSLENTTGSITVVNSGDIGFASSCVPQCGEGHIGIAIGHSATGDVSVTNVGNIAMGSGGVERLSINIPGQAPVTSEIVTANTAILLTVPYGNNVTVTNTGNITGGEYSSAVGIIAGAGAQNRVINFNGGEVKTDEIVNGELALGGTTTVNVNAGTEVEGRFNFGGTIAAGAETVNVNSGGTLVITNGESKFGAGADAIVVNEGGHLNLSNDATGGSDGVTISGLETFTLNAKSTLSVYLDSNFNAFSMATSIAINGGSDAPTLVINLPVGYDLAARSAFTLIGVTGTNTVTVDAATLRGLANNVRLVRGSQRFKGGSALTFSLSADGTNLQMAWNDSLEAIKFNEIARGLGGDDNQSSVALALSNAAERSGNPNLYRDLFNAVEDSGDAKNLESSLAPIYGSLVQSSWFAGHRFVNEVMENFCSRHRVTGLKKLSYSEHSTRNKRTSCGRADIWSSVTRKSDDDGAVGFEENSLFNFGGFWSRGLNKHFTFSGAVSYGLINHESNRGGESYGHRVSGAAVLHLTQNGALQRNGFIASAGATVSGSIFDVDRDTVGGGSVTSDVSMVTYGLHARGGLRLTLLGDMFIEPRGGISFSQLFMQETQEEVSRRVQGTSDFNLALDDGRHSFTSLHGSVMMGDQWQLSNSMQMEPSLKAGLTYIATGTDIDVNSRFVGDLNEQNFIAYNNDMDRLFVDISTGFLLFGDEEMLGSLDYEGMFSLIGKTRRHSARLRLSF